MKTELLHKYFRGETTEKEENQIVEWVESSVENKEHFLNCLLYTSDAADE